MVKTVKDATQRRAEIEAELAEIAAKEKADNQPLIDEANAILADSDTRTRIARLAEIARALPPAAPYTNARMLGTSLEQTFGAAVNAFESAK